MKGLEKDQLISEETARNLAPIARFREPSSQLEINFAGLAGNILADAQLCASLSEKYRHSVADPSIKSIAGVNDSVHYAGRVAEELRLSYLFFTCSIFNRIELGGHNREGLRKQGPLVIIDTKFQENSPGLILAKTLKSWGVGIPVLMAIIDCSNPETRGELGKTQLLSLTTLADIAKLK